MSDKPFNSTSVVHPPSFTTQVITSVAEMRSFSRQARARGKSIALVPTMGALHEGHLSLVRQAKRQCDVVIVSIFVNPTQFGPGEDFSVYPRRPEQDLEALRSLKVDAIFKPDTGEMYPHGYDSAVEPGGIANLLEGARRPGHFRGVATVVVKLFNMVRPDVTYFGQKDFQQVLVVRRVVEELNLDVQLAVCPIVREEDGLAMSSRNAYFSPEDRKAAPVLYRALRSGEKLAQAGETDTKRIREEVEKVLAAEPRAQMEYVAIVDSARLTPIDRVTAGCVALVAARVGPVRLVDNLIFGPAGTRPELLLEMALAARAIAPLGARIPGLETEMLRQRIHGCRDCAAISSILLPPREFLVKFLKRDYQDLNAVRILVIGRDAPANPENFLYQNPTASNRFVKEIYELLGVKNFEEFRARFALTDALRCHATSPRVSDKAAAYCVRHLHEELKLFPNLETVVVLGEDAYVQFQRHILGRADRQVKPHHDLLGPQGWAQEQAQIPSLGGRELKIVYCHHPTFGYKRSPSIASLLRQ